MIILALDATEQACSVAVTDGINCIEKVEQAPRRHAELLLPLLDAVLIEGGWASSDIDLLAVTAGPGAFTGLRIAVSAMQGLAFAWNCPVMPISTLAALVRGAYRIHGGDYFLPAMDARMEQVYWGAYQITRGIPHPLCADQLNGPDEIDFSSVSHSGYWQGIGSGWCYKEILANKWREATQEDVVVLDKPFFCHAQDIAFCAQAAIEQGQLPLTAEQLLPVYIREAQFKKLAS